MLVYQRVQANCNPFLRAIVSIVCYYGILWGDFYHRFLHPQKIDSGEG